MARRLCFSDAHCHIRPAAAGAATSTALHSDHALTSDTQELSGQLRRLVLCGTHPQLDWHLLARIASQASETRANPQTLPRAMLHVHSSAHSPSTTSSHHDTATQPCELLVGFGLHPWYVPHEERDNNKQDTQPSSSSSSSYTKDNDERGMTMSLRECMAELEAMLQRFPRAIVGEIGLDKLRGPRDEEVQAAAFLAQMRLAAQYHRPVSVHCVRHYGLLLQLLQRLPAEATPPAIILHAFTGSTEVAKSLLKLKHKKVAAATTASISSSSGSAVVKIGERIFFSAGSRTSWAVRSFAAETLPLLLRTRRLLLETDAHYEYAHTTTTTTGSSSNSKSRSDDDNDNNGERHGEVVQLGCEAAAVYEPLVQLAERVAEAADEAVRGDARVSNEEEEDRSSAEGETSVLEDVFALAFQSVL